MKQASIFFLVLLLFTSYVSADDNLTETKEFDDAVLTICSDSKCNNPESVFVLNRDKIFAKLSDPYGADVTAVIIDPRGQEAQTDLHDGLAYVTAAVSGDYELKVFLSKDQFAPRIIKNKFYVLEKLPVIRKEQLCNDDAVCDEGENYQNCPQDCAEEKGGLWLYLALAMFFIIAIVIVVFIVMRRRKREPEQPTQMPAAQGYYPQQRQFDSSQYRRFR